VERVRTATAKVVPPAVPDLLVARPRLNELLAESLNRRVTLVVAGAGFGKSVLLSSWAAQTRCTWFTADRSDQTLAILGRGLVDALRLRMPDLPVDLASAVEGVQGPDEDQLARAEALGGLVSEALFGLAGDQLTVVVDDLQELLASPASSRLIESLCRQGPDHVHLILSSRVDPPFALERLKGRGQVNAIGAHDLSFSREETTELLVNILGSGGPQIAEDLHELTRGWPAALRLAAEALRKSEAIERNRLIEGLRGGAVFAYLAAEVFDQEEPHIRDFIKRVAPLTRFNAELCAELGIADASQVIDDVRRRGLYFDNPESVDGWYSLSSLARGFVLEHLQLDEEEIATTHSVAGRWLEDNGLIDLALEHLIASKETHGIAKLLREHGDAALSAGTVDGIIRAAELLPIEERDESVGQVVGQAHLVRGDWNEALDWFEQAARGADRYSPRFAWRMGLIHHLRGDLDTAIEIYRRSDLEGIDPRDEALLLAWEASAHWVRGDPESCRGVSERAHDAATRSRDQQAAAAVHTVLAMLAAYDGDRRASETHYFLARDAADRAGDVLQLIRIGANRASHLNEEGMYLDALSHIESVISLAEAAGYATYLGLCMINRGEALVGLGRLEEAAAEYEAAKALYERIASTDVCYAFCGLGDVHRERGDLSVARAAYEEALRIAEEAGDAQGLIPALAGLARVLALDDGERALNLATKAVEYEPSLWMVKCLLALGWVQLAMAKRKAAAATAERAGTTARERRDRAGLAESLELEALSAPDPRAKTSCLEEAIALWREIGNPVAEARAQIALAHYSNKSTKSADIQRAERTLRDLGVRAQSGAGGSMLVGVVRRGSLTIQTLGGLQVFRDDTPLSGADWKSRKARDLLKILTARRGRMTPRDVLMQTLWPEEDDAAKLTNRFGVALTTLRTVLDPDKRFGTNHFVTTDKDAVGLDLDHIEIDVETFLTNAVEGLRLQREGRAEEAFDRMVMAEEAYRGDFLEGDPYEDWAAPLREEARATYISVTRQLAHQAGSHDSDVAGRFFLRLLARDAYDEDAHIGLIAALDRGGRHGEARRAYRTYVRRMEELGVEAAHFPHARVS
jgi:ATP/maltotriose-dependent transcriptional regulator MalT/DNA-binding SARP family transcriptional activator